MTSQNLIYDVLPAAVMQALGWTLLHALWQGTLIALVIAVLLSLMHRHSATIRYQVASAGLVVLLLISALTFYKLYNPAGAIASAPVVADAETTRQVNLPHAAIQSVDWWEKAGRQGQTYFNEHLPAVVTLWLLGMLLMGLRVLGGWVYVQRLRSYRTRVVPEVWHQKTRELSQKLDISQLVGLAESAMVQVPMVIGHIRPLILLPLGTLTGLSSAQVEAILAHELAHVYRRDYFFNLLQSLVETLFFFHPAVWWLSDCIRTEREHACDDLALALCGDSLTYVYALTNLEELIRQKNLSAPSLSMAFSGRRRSLLSRITRLVQKPALRPSFSEGFLSSCAVIASILVFAAGAWANNPVPDKPVQQAKPEEKTAVVQPNSKTAVPVAAPDETESGFTLKQLDDDLIIVQNKKGKVVELYVNGKRVPKSELGKYQTRIEQQLAAAKESKPVRNEAELENMRHQLEASLESLKEDDNWSIPQIPLVPRLPEIPRAPDTGELRGMLSLPPLAPLPPLTPFSDDEKALTQYKKSVKEYEARMKEYEARIKEYSARQKELVARVETDQKSRFEDLTHRLEEHKQQVSEHGLRMQDYVKQMAEQNKKMAELRERMKKQDAMLQALKASLLADGLIKSADADYNFKLDHTGLYLDDKQQSEALFEKYKKIIQDTTGEDIELLLKQDGYNIRMKSNNSSESKE